MNFLGRGSSGNVKLAQRVVFHGPLLSSFVRTAITKLTVFTTELALIQL